MASRCFLPDAMDVTTLLALVPECTLYFGGPMVVPMALVSLVYFLLMARKSGAGSDAPPLPLSHRDGSQPH